MTHDSHEILSLRVVYWKLRTWFAQLVYAITDRTRQMPRTEGLAREICLREQTEDEQRLSLVAHKLAKIEAFAEECGVTL